MTISIHTELITKEDAERLLQDWGDWQEGMDNLGFSKVNTLGRKSFIPGKFEQAVIPDMSPDVQLVEDAVNRMHPRTKIIVTKYYAHGWTQIEITERLKGVKRSEVRNRLDSAANILIGYAANAA